MSEMNSQEGGMKIIVKNDKGEDMSIRQIEDKAVFTSIFNNTLMVETVSIFSLKGFILRITLPPDSTPFRSDIFNEEGELMNADEYQLPNTGRLVTEHILKCCIVQQKKGPIIAQFSGRDKRTCTSEQLFQEYHNQTDIYNATMAYSGMPVCPDAYAVMEFNLTEFRNIFFHDTLPPGRTNHFKDNLVFRYLLAQLEAPLPPPFERKVGIILMESLPPSYQPLKNLYATFSAATPGAISLNTRLAANKKLFDNMAHRALAICIVVLYRIGFIPPDAHLENWMYDTTQTFDQFKVKAIDFGSVIRCKEPGIDDIRKYIQDYIMLYEDPQEKAFIISGLARLLGINPSTVKTAEICGTKVREIIVELNKLIRRNQNGSILWNSTGPRFTVVTRLASSGHHEQTMEIDSCMILIHRILFLIALIDGCFNMSTFKEYHYCQLRDLFSSLFGNKCTNLATMIKSNVYIDFVTYLRAIPTDIERIRTIEAYRRIRDNIGEYLRVTPERGLFPDPFYQDPSPDTLEDPAVVALREAVIPPQHRSPRTSRSNSPSKKSKVSPSQGSPRQGSHPPPKSSPGGGSIGTKKLIKSMKQRKLKQSRKSIKTKLSKMLKTKKNKNHNRYRRNKRYRL
jgi:hypothetical protein